MNGDIAPRRGAKVLGNAFIDALDWSEVVGRIGGWAARKESRYVCICNSHSVVTATQDKVFSFAVNAADMATPDGAPVAWMLRALGFSSQSRINGPDLMLAYCKHAAEISEPIFLYGNTESTLKALIDVLHARFPGLVIAGSYSPPFRPLSEDEDRKVVDRINESGARTVWVSLGCPKQEIWMAEHRGRVNAVMVGVGAAFDYHAGTIKRAPLWMQRSGFEWLHRLCSEPRRLWRRYFTTNSLFLIGAARQLLRRNGV